MTITSEQLKKAEAAHRAAFRRSEQKREARNELVRQALAQGWKPAHIAREMGITRARVGQIGEGEP